MGVLECTSLGLLDFHKKGVDFDENLSLVTKGFSRKEGVDLVDDFALVVGGFEVLLEVLRCMDKICMFTVYWRPCVGWCLHYELGIS
jgi:hypothetical protein